MRILCVANDVPLPANSGGRVDVWRRLQALKGAGHELALVCWTDEGRASPLSAAERAALGALCDEVKVLSIRRSVSEVVQRLLWLWRWPSHVAARWVTSRRAALVPWARAWAPELVLLDGLYGGAVALDLATQLGVPLAYRSHNVEHQYMAEQRAREQRAVRRLGLFANCLGLERFERRVMGRAAEVLDISLADAAFWRGQGFAQVTWVPTLVDAPFAGRLAHGPVQASFDLLYFGNLNTPNNVEALTWLVREVLPRVPGAGLRIAIAGSGPTQAVRALVATDSRVVLIENPPDMAAVVSAARVLVNPMRAGSGVNLKSVEMLFTEAALVSTPVGVKGMPELAQACFSVADGAEDFAAAVARGLSPAWTGQGDRPAARALFSDLALLEAIRRAASSSGRAA
jgi:glycosyltransferase involved in cell wall biosynthesis